MKRPSVPKAAEIYRAGKPLGEDASSSSPSEDEEPLLVQKQANQTPKNKIGVVISQDSIREIAKQEALNKAAIEAAQKAALVSESSSSSDKESEESSHDGDFLQDTEEDEEKQMPRLTFKSQKNAQDARQKDQLQEEKVVKELARDMLKAAMERNVEKQELQQEQVDDTDNLDPEEEYNQWKLRELSRIQRDRDSVIQLEKQREDLENQRNMTHEQLKELEIQRKQQSRDKRSKKTMKFLQKYYHKGAFFQEQEILGRDYSAPTESENVDKSILPKPLQIRGDQIGKAGRTRWTHLINEDTSKRDAGWSQIPEKVVKKLGGMRDVDTNSKRRRVT